MRSGQTADAADGFANAMTGLYGRDAWEMPRTVSGRSSTAQPKADAAVVIGVYPDQFPDDPENPLESTIRFARDVVGPEPVLHILPPYLSASGDRFAVIDHLSIDPLLGSWRDIERGRPVMLDLVVNQVPAESDLFIRAVDGDPEALAAFVQVADSFDLSTVTASSRDPRTRVRLGGQERSLWSSFGPHQYDLDYRNPAVMGMTLSRLAELAGRSDWLRLDGVAYTWKSSGTKCANLPEARLVCSALANAWRALASGSSVAEVDDYDEESYFDAVGHGPDLVIDFRFMPAMAAALLLEDVNALEQVCARHARLARARALVGPMTHDGITLRPWAPVLKDATLTALLGRAEEVGLSVQVRESPGRQQGAYELDETIGSLARVSGDTPELFVRRALLPTSVSLTTRAVPYLYLVGALGLETDAQTSGRARVRRPWPVSELAARDDVLDVKSSLHRMLSIRTSAPELSPRTPMTVWSDGPVLAIERHGPEARLVALHNFGREHRTARIGAGGIDLLTREEVPATARLAPYETRWIRAP